MGWANCGADSKGRPIGYAHDAMCDHPGCEAKIHRGLAYACGGEHGETEYGCELYFCYDHLISTEFADGRCVSICQSCLSLAVQAGALAANEMAAYREETE